MADKFIVTNYERNELISLIKEASNKSLKKFLNNKRNLMIMMFSCPGKKFLNY